MSRLTELEDMHDANPDDPFILYAMAREYEQIQSTMHAMLIYEHLVSKFPSYIGTYYHYSKLLYSLGNRKEARRMIEKGIEQALREKDLHSTSELKGLIQMWWPDEDE